MWSLTTRLPLTSHFAEDSLCFLNPEASALRSRNMHRSIQLTLISLFLNATYSAPVQSQPNQSESIPVVAADPIAKLGEVVITSTREDLQGIATSASEGVVTSKQLRTRPIQRAGDLMESVPGLVATQHSGEGKANQYFLRGFNLDHGTDLNTLVDGVPINLPTHGHGQGYTDLYFLIPELVDSVAYRKGPYYAQDGDFATAGSVRMRTINRISRPSVLVESGSFRYRRALALGSIALGNGNWLGAAEKVADDGPWSVKQNLRKLNFSSKYSEGTDKTGWSIGVNHYEAIWTATDQIADRAVGQIISVTTDGKVFGRYDSLDPTNGGLTKRDAINASWALAIGDEQFRASAYAIKYRFNLFSNFTYFANGCDGEPLAAQCNGSSALDQFEQVDRRIAFGLNLSHAAPLTLSITKLGAQDASLIVGIDMRRDSISEVGLYDTSARSRTITVRNDRATIDAIGIWAQGQWQWTDQFRTTLGLRQDYRRNAVIASIEQNSGKRNASISSPKLSAVYSPSKNADLYANWGRGFHSNDARGTVIKVNPRDPTEAAPAATPLVTGTGYEIGTRQKLNKNLVVTAALWQLRLDSELIFVGDAGTTEPSRPSTRRGLELTANWQLTKALQIDADASWTRSRFVDNDPAGPYLPGAMRRVLSIGASYQDGPWTIGTKLRSFGKRPLIEDNSLQGSASTLANVKASYTVNPNWEFSAEVFNIFNRQVNDIEYAYASRLPGEAAFIASNTPITKHSHPSLPRTMRIGLKISF